MLARTDSSVVDQIADAIWQTYANGRGTVYLFGNGACAALASHFACDLGKGTIVGDHPPPARGGAHRQRPAPYGVGERLALR